MREILNAAASFRCFPSFKYFRRGVPQDHAPSPVRMPSSVSHCRPLLEMVLKMVVGASSARASYYMR